MNAWLKIFLCSVGLVDSLYFHSHFWIICGCCWCCSKCWRSSFWWVFWSALNGVYIAILKYLCIQCIGFVHDFIFMPIHFFIEIPNWKTRTRSFPCSQTAGNKIQFNFKAGCFHINYDKVCLVDVVCCRVFACAMSLQYTVRHADIGVFCVCIAVPVDSHSLLIHFALLAFIFNSKIRRWNLINSNKWNADG